jgi:hypothetical protein
LDGREGLDRQSGITETDLDLDDAVQAHS